LKKSLDYITGAGCSHCSWRFGFTTLDTSPEVIQWRYLVDV